MTRLTLADLADEKPVRLNVELSARLHRELLAYGIAITMAMPKEHRRPNGWSRR